jgi:hypothetical protein
MARFAVACGAPRQEQHKRVKSGRVSTQYKLLFAVNAIEAGWQIRRAAGIEKVGDRFVGLRDDEGRTEWEKTVGVVSAGIAIGRLDLICLATRGCPCDTDIVVGALDGPDGEGGTISGAPVRNRTCRRCSLACCPKNFIGGSSIGSECCPFLAHSGSMSVTTLTCCVRLDS